jgi:hypothetical protein
MNSRKSRGFTTSAMKVLGHSLSGRGSEVTRMTGTRKEVVRLRFKRERFRDRALDLTALTELRQFQKIVAETAKALWRAAHPDQERLPAQLRGSNPTLPAPHRGGQRRDAARSLAGG